MKQLLAFLTSLVLFVPFTNADTDSEYYSYSYARLSYVKGDVFVQRAEDLGYEEGTVNLPLIEGEKLGTREGRAEIHFGRKNYLRIDNFTQIDLVKLPSRENDQIKLHLLSGNVYLRINFLEREKDFEIHTPDASFYILEEGLYRFGVTEDKETELLVLEGSAEAAGEEGSVLVRGDEKLVVSDGYFLTDPEYSYSSYDESFSEWNRSRDDLQNRHVGRNYLPSDLYEYEAELADNGRWVYERSHGYVWVPRVYHNSWRPYYHGRWVWYPIIGWNWVSYDPWGWCVSHYGRWHWRLGLGWYWIPTRHWGPAWVHWYWGHNYIGWCPLSYYNCPVVIVNNRFYGRYYNRNYPVHSRALTVIHKDQLQARRISKVALSQSRAAKLGKVSLSAKQPGIKPVVSKSRIANSEAARVLSRSNMRPVGKVYSSGIATRSLSRSRVNADKIRESSTASIRSSTLRRNNTESRDLGKLTSSRVFSRTLTKKYSSSSTLTRSSERSSSELSRSLRSTSTVKMYPSRQSSTARSKSSFGSREGSNTQISTKRYSPERSYKSSESGAIKERESSISGRYSKSSSYSSRYGSSYRSSTSSSRSYSSSNRSKSSSRSGYIPSSSSSSRSYRSYNDSRSSYKASSRSYSRSAPSSSRYKSSSSGRVSSSRSYSAPSRSRSSSRSSVSRSSSSSSRSSSSQKVRK